MTKYQQEILQDLRAFIDRSIFEGDFENCLTVVARDVSELMFKETCFRITNGERCKIALPPGLPGLRMG